MIEFTMAMAVAISSAARAYKDDGPAWILAKVAQGETGRLFAPEARAEEWVMWTVRNRVDSPHFYDDYWTVVEHGYHGHRRRGEPDGDLLALARQVMAAPVEADPTGGCLFVFSADDMEKMDWSRAGAVREVWAEAKGRQWGLFFFRGMPGE